MNIVGFLFLFFFAAKFLNEEGDLVVINIVGTDLYRSLEVEKVWEAIDVKVEMSSF